MESQLYTTLMSEIKKAMLSHDTIRKNVLSLIIAECTSMVASKNIQITDEVVLSLIKKSAKQHKDSIKQFEEGKRYDLATKEKHELDVLEEFLPKMLTEEETRKIIFETLSSMGVETFDKKMTGKVMGQLKINPTIDKSVAIKILNTL